MDSASTISEIDIKKSLSLSQFFLAYPLGHHPNSRRAIDDLVIKSKAASESLSSILRQLAKEKPFSLNEVLQTEFLIADAHFTHLEAFTYSNYADSYKGGQQSFSRSDLEELLTSVDFDRTLRGDPSLIAFINDLREKDTRYEFIVSCFGIASFYFHRIIRQLELYPKRVKTSQARVIRSLRFPPEFRQSGIAILSYFSEILESKYPEMEVSVQIHQNGNKVTLEIETPEGKREVVEEELKQYGLVVLNERSVESFLPNQYDALRLQQRLDMVNAELRGLERLRESERQSYQSQIGSLEDQMGFLRELLITDKDASKTVLEQVLGLLKESGSREEQAVKAVIEKIEAGDDSLDVDVVERCFAEVKRDDQNLFEKLQGMILKGSIEGAAGNGFLALLKAISAYG